MVPGGDHSASVTKKVTFSGDLQRAEKDDFHLENLALVAQAVSILFCPSKTGRSNAENECGHVEVFGVVS